MDQVNTFADMSLEERSYAIKILSELDTSGTSPALDTLWSEDFIRKPVSPSVFMSDPYYLGHDVSSKIYPIWRTVLTEVLDVDSPIIELVLSGSIGSGKSSTAVIALMYKLYYLSCLRNPQSYYGLMEHAMIAFVMFSATLGVISNTSYGDFLSMFRLSPYFNNHYNSSKAKNIELADRNVKVLIGSNEVHEQGLNVYAAILDESNYIGPKSDRDHVKAFAIYSQISTRMESRFMRAGLLCLISSARTNSDYIDVHIEKARGNPSVMVRSYPIWTVKNKPGMYSGEKFRVDLGTKFRSPTIMASGAEDPLEGRVIEVPIEYIASFKRDLYQSIRDVIGVSGQPLSPFIPDKEVVQQCVDTNMVNPFKVPTVYIDIDDTINIDSYFDAGALFKHEYGRYSLISHPAAARCAHIDLADTNDPCGLAIGHIGDTRTVTRVLPNGETFMVDSSVVYIDLMIQLRPRLGHRLDYSKIREFFHYLMSMNMVFDKVTLDSYQSSDMIQYFTKNGITSKVLSVDRNDVPYISLKNALLENRIQFYDYPIFIEEVSNLEHDIARSKVDHKVGATKDVADAVAAVVHSLMAAEKSLGDPVLSMSPDMVEGAGKEKATIVSDYATGMRVTDIESYKGFQDGI